MRLNSLAFRLFATSTAWTLLVLPLLYRLVYGDKSQQGVKADAATILKAE